MPYRSPHEQEPAPSDRQRRTASDQQSERAAQDRAASVEQTVRSAGRPLSSEVRSDMEARLGADFGGVRVHDGATAQRSAIQIGARAYTSGEHIVLGPGGQDRHTLAHELTHVIQQRQGPVAGTPDASGLRISDPTDRFERAAETGAARALAGHPPASQAQRGPGRAPSAVQRALTVGQHNYTQEFRQNNRLPEQEQKQRLEELVQRILTRIDAETRMTFTPDERSDFASERDKITWQLKRTIVEPTGHQGLHPVLGREVGNHPDFGAKMRDIHVNDETELARGLIGWVRAKGKRHQEKELAKEVRESGDVEVFLDSLLRRINDFTDQVKDGLPPDQQAVMENELRTGLVHLNSQTPGNPPTGGRPFSSYLGYFSAQNNPQKFGPGSPLAYLAIDLPALGGFRAVMSSPEDHPFRTKMAVLHDIMEYFGEPRHTPPTQGTGKLAPLVSGPEVLSTIGTADGERLTDESRGQVAIRPHDTTHPSTRDENDATTRWARQHRVPVWAGQSFTAARMFKMAQQVGGSPRETAALAWGIFAFWRSYYDHTHRLAYHTLHEVLDIAQNFHVPYDIADQAAGLDDVTVSATEDDLGQLAGQIPDLIRQTMQLREFVAGNDGSRARRRVRALNDVLNNLSIMAARLPALLARWQQYQDDQEDQVTTQLVQDSETFLRVSAQAYLTVGRVRSEFSPDDA